MQDIYDKLKVDFEFITGWIYKGLAQALGAGYASRLKEFNDKLAFIVKNAFISTADKDYLYLNASNMIPPKPAEIAQGFVIFYGINGSVIPAQTEIKDDNGTFKVISDATIATTTLTGTVTVTGVIATTTISNQLTSTTALVNGISKSITVIDGTTIQFDAGTLTTGDAVTIAVSNALANVISDVAGIAGNRILNSVLKLKITIAGLNTELGALAIAGGIDDEDVEVYRQRVMYFMANPQAPFSRQNIITTNKERISTLKYVWVKGGEVVDGTVQIIAINKSYGLTANEITEITKNTKAISPANFDTATAVTITNATVIGIDIVINSLLPSSVGLQNEITKNIQYFFDNDFYEKAITQSSLEAIIYKTTNSAETVESFTLVSGWQTATANTFWKLDNVIFS